MCRDESGIVAEDLSKQHLSIAIHPSCHLVLFCDGFMVTAVEPLPSSGVDSCLSLIRRLTAASEQTLSHLLTLRPSLKSSFFNRLKDNEHIVGTALGHNSETRSHYNFEAAPDDLTWTTIDQEFTGGSYVDSVDRGRILVGHAENLSNSAEHRSAVVVSADADRLLGLVSRTLMLSWGLAATHSGMWTMEHETVAEAVAYNFVKLFAVILRDGENGEEDGTRLQQVLELYHRVIRLTSMDHLGQHLPVVLVTFICRSAELFLKMRLTGVKGLHTLHAVALAIRYAEQHYTITYSLTSTVNLPRPSAVHYLDHISTATDTFTVPSLFAAGRLDWVGLKKNRPVLATLHNRLADNCFCCKCGKCC